MSVCLRCGGQIKETDKFCGFCGYPIKRPTQDQQTNSNNQNGKNVPPQIRTKDELIAEINRMLEYFSKVRSLYDEYDRCAKKVRRIEDKRGKRIEYNNKNERYTDDTDIFEDMEDNFEFLKVLLSGDPDSIASVFFVLSIFMFIAIVVILLLLRWPYSLLIAVGCSFFCSLFVFLGVYFIIKGKREERTETQEICKLYDEMKSLKAKQIKHYKNYGYCIVDFDDADPRILSRVRKYLMAGKVNTLEEALRKARRRWLKIFTPVSHA